MLKLIALQILSHLVSDFYFQTNKSCKNKAEKGFRSPYLYVHVLITFICSWIFSLLYPYTYDFWWAALVISISHGIIDGLKSRFKNIPWIFFVDQFLHVIVIVSVTYWFCGTVYLECIGYEREVISILLEWLPASVLLWCIAFVFCLRPANIFIREIMSNVGVLIPNNNVQNGRDNSLNTNIELPNAGRLIGIVERVLTLIFMLLGQFEAIGFLLAAKSLLRFKEEDSVKSEYVLVGTLLSFGMAIVAGACVLLLMKRI